MIGTCHILKVLHESLRQTATQLCVHRCYVVHTHRALSTAPAFVRLGSKVSSLGCLAASQRHQVASVHCTARSRSSPEDRGKSVSRYQSGTPKPSAAQKVKEAGRDFTYLIVVLLGLGVTGGLLYVVFQELFSSSSPNKVYSRAFDIVKSHPEVRISLRSYHDNKLPMCWLHLDSNFKICSAITNNVYFRKHRVCLLCVTLLHPLLCMQDTFRLFAVLTGDHIQVECIWKYLLTTHKKNKKKWISQKIGIKH
uniref:Mitochondrial import inner membrane translocase subunit Tim21 n=1 Tax=Poecilia reticulata TaxID=8081 RepID=A0A3P9PFS6_POERE